MRLEIYANSVESITELTCAKLKIGMGGKPVSYGHCMEPSQRIHLILPIVSIVASQYSTHLAGHLLYLAVTTGIDSGLRWIGHLTETRFVAEPLA